MSGRGPFAILGLGLVGGSLARDLAALGSRVLGYDDDATTMRAARRARVVHGEIGADLAGLREARTVVLAVPVDAAPALLARAAPFLNGDAVVTDVGSTKERIHLRAAALGIDHLFVGSHPLAGDHRSGWKSSRRGLFDGACVFVCPSARATRAARARVASLWRSVGASPRETAPAAHDAELAFTSHLPHLVALALALTLDQNGHTRASLGPGGHDATRLAASSPAMWRAIVAENAPRIALALAACEIELRRVRDTVEAGDVDAIERLFASAGDWASPNG